MSDASSIMDEAVSWHLRQESMSADAWASFVAWLEQEEHARAYDAVARADRLLAQVRFPQPVAAPAAANDDEPTARRRWWAWGGSVGAAGIAAALALSVLPLASGDQAQRFVTRDGEQRTVKLDDGSVIAMNGGTAIRVAMKTRAVRLERGEVMLSVKHDAAAPFELAAGDQVVRDLGTRFNVAFTERTLAVAVADGAVALGRGDQSVRLKAGDAVRVDLASGDAVRSAVARDAVGGWNIGVLSFASVPLAEVAAALRRRNGVDIALEGDLPRRPFTGIIRLTGRADRDIPHLAEMIGASWRRDGMRWILAAQGATRP